MSTPDQTPTTPAPKTDATSVDAIDAELSDDQLEAAAGGYDVGDIIDAVGDAIRRLGRPTV